MATVYDVLVIVHILCWLSALVLIAMHLRTPLIPKGTWHAIAAALATGFILTGIASASDEVADLNNAKIAVKLVIGTSALLVAILEGKKPAPNRAAYLVGGLVLTNVAIAYLW